MLKQLPACPHTETKSINKVALGCHSELPFERELTRPSEPNHSAVKIFLIVLLLFAVLVSLGKTPSSSSVTSVPTIVIRYCDAAQFSLSFIQLSAFRFTLNVNLV